MDFKRYSVAGVLLFLPLVSVAAPSINDMQTCQGLIDFLDHRLESAPAEYPVSDVLIIRKGLKSYNQYIQWEIISPGLLAFSSGNSKKAQALQQQVDGYKASIVKGYQKRYPDQRLYTDHAVAINNCANKAVPTGQSLTELRLAVETMVELAVSHR